MRRLVVLLGIVLVAASAAAVFLWRTSGVTGPGLYPREADEHFKYGSIGAEVNGYPYLIWRELPRIVADKIPEGWASFGFIRERGRDLPIGISIRRYNVERVGFNCGTCHTSTVNGSP